MASVWTAPTTPVTPTRDDAMGRVGRDEVMAAVAALPRVNGPAWVKLKRLATGRIEEFPMKRVDPAG